MPLPSLPMAQLIPEGAGEFRLPSKKQDFVLDTVTTAVGNVPRVGSRLRGKDRRGHYLVRWNIGRDCFTVDPGLYALNDPCANDHILVTANYKLTFDLLRQIMGNRSCWILVLDTKGINVWCAAGKGSFGTEELVDRIQASRLMEVVQHRQLIVPQLGATGVAAFEVKKHSGFSVVYGPVMLVDLPAFLDNDCNADPAMRIKNFPFTERLVLVPVEIMQGLKQGIPLILLFFLLAGLMGDDSFSNNIRLHAFPPALAILCGIGAGTILTPLLLPWIPGRAFSIKGAICGLLLFSLTVVPTYVASDHYTWLEKSSWICISLAIASWFGMAFTGASTFTSLNGVRKEMMRGIPAQFIGLAGGILLWIVALWLT